jgi:hypothetical protein
MPVDLFNDVASKGVQHPRFLRLRNSVVHAGARNLMNEVFAEMGDSDGNFVKDFQSGGFDARIFEMCLYAAFREINLEIDKSQDSPDFLLSTHGMKAAVEATTVNPEDSIKHQNSLEQLVQITNEEIYSKILDEVPIKVGGPLNDKKKKKYWNLPQCKDLPLIFAIQDMHEPASLCVPDIALCTYLYGIREQFILDKAGNIICTNEKIDRHRMEKKDISSNFFNQEGSEYISAVLFSNSYTVPKFLRMAYLAGWGHEQINLFKEGFCRMPSDNTIIPYKYDLKDPNAPTETWGQGLTLFKNPNALHPVPNGLFEGVTTVELIDGDLVGKVYDFHPINGVTIGTPVT